MNDLRDLQMNTRIEMSYVLYFSILEFLIVPGL